MSSQRTPVPCARWAWACASSTSEHLRRPRCLDVDLPTRGNEIAGDHDLVGLPRSDNLLDVRVGIDYDLDESRPCVCEELVYDTQHGPLSRGVRLSHDDGRSHQIHLDR